MLFCLVNLVYNIFFYILLHNTASVNTGPRTRHSVPAAALHNFFLFLLKYPLHFTSYFLNCILLKIVHCVQKTNNAFSIDKYKSDYTDISLLRQINSFFSNPKPTLTCFSPILFWNVSNLFTTE